MATGSSAGKLPREDIQAWGVDQDPANRPGVPMEALPPKPYPGAHWTSPPRQEPRVTVLKRPSLKELTPVFGTMQPPHGLSGTLRKLAYTIPEHKTRHWALLLFADRVDMIESGFGELSGKLRQPLSIGLGAGLLITSLIGVTRWRALKNVR